MEFSDNIKRYHELTKEKDTITIAANSLRVYGIGVAALIITAMLRVEGVF